MRPILKILSGGLLITIFTVVTLTVFLVGYVRGYNFGQASVVNISSTTKPVATVSPSRAPQPATKSTSWGGPQLWDAVNKRRVEFGVNPLKQKDELCTIASIRLNQILELGKLDGHEGFSKLPESRPDLKWIFEKYNISEFLVSGADSPQNAVSLWENTLGHKKLLTGGEYSWGCIYAQNGVAVAITAY